MNRRAYRHLVVLLIIFGLVSFACTISKNFDWVPVTLCEATGGIWTTTDQFGETIKEPYCFRPKTEVDTEDEDIVQDPAPAVDEIPEDDGGGDEVEEPPDVCVVYPEDYSWEFFDTTIETGKKGTLCLSNFRFENTSNTTLILYPFLDVSRGTDGSQYAGYGLGGRILKPGEIFEDNVNQTIYDKGAPTFRLYRMMLVLYNNPDCLWMNPEIAEEDQISDSFVILPNPCE